MELWVALALMLTAIAGIVLLSVKLKGKDEKVGYILGIIGFAVIVAVALGYIGLTLLFIGSIQ